MQRSGFSLVELSIVLVILGLLVGGILGGQSLIRAAELRSVTTDISKFQTALNAFQGKYSALPGDMTNAIEYWGAAHATPATCATTAGTGTQTCNGDGNGSIATNGSPGTYYESWRAWQQLGIAGMAEGNFTGIGTGNTYGATPGTNVPVSKIKGGGWTLFGFGTVGDGILFAGTYKNVLLLGATVANDIAYGPLLPPEDAFSIDSKVDDGKPGTGSVLALRSPASCTTTQVGSTALYALTTSANACAMAFKLGF